MKYTLPLSFISLFLIAVWSHAAFAQDEPKRHMLLQKFVDEKGLKIYYLGKSYGMDGWALKNGDNTQFAYSTPEGGIVFGMQFGPEGALETTTQLKGLQGRLQEERITSIPPTDGQSNPAPQTATTSPQTQTQTAAVSQPVQIPPHTATQQPEKKKSKSEIFYSEAENANWVSIGNDSAPYIYIFINPACEHCKAYWNDIKPSVEAGTIQVRFIPFGRVKINRDAGAALLAIDDPATAWAAYADGNTKTLSADLANNESYAKLDANSMLWAKWQLKVPPFTVYRSPANDKINVIAGRPDNTLLLLSEMTQ